jgi:hypothetical protein
MLLTALLVALGQTPPAPECHTSGQTVACGYHCVAALGVVECAKTPEGLCAQLEGKTVCWDPPEEVRLHPPKRAAAPHCEAKYRDVQCGYSCLTSPNHLSCAQTPWGVCTTRFDDVACWDPSDAVIHHRSAVLDASSGTARAPHCVQSETAYACGWDCKRSRNEVACAQTPDGTCRLFDGKIACFDPPLPSISHEPQPTAKK